MQQDRALQTVGFTQVLVDLHAVVAHRGVDSVPRAGQIRKFAAQAKAHHADLARAVRTRPEGGDNIAKVPGELVGIQARAQ